MKYILSISLTLLILLTGLNVKIASHYCGGQISAVKVSLTGEVATCGMEHKPARIPLEVLFSRHCCDDVVSSVYMSTTYVPASGCFAPPAGYALNHSAIAYDLMVNIQSVLFTSLPGRGRPPGGFCPSDVHQQVICIFQI